MTFSAQFNTAFYVPSFKCAVVEDNLPPAIASGNLIIIRLGKGYNAHILKYFFDSEIGNQLIAQVQTGVSAPIINPAKFKDIMIPNIPTEKQQDLAKMIVNSNKRYKQMMKEAEDLLSRAKNELNKEMKLISR
jgi:restriction endonuclease S subunit